MPTTEHTPETMANTEHTPEKKPSRWYLAGHYLQKGIAWILIAYALRHYDWSDNAWSEYDHTGWSIVVFAGVYLLVNTKKK